MNERLQELRAEHRPQECLVESCACVRCIKVQCNHEHVWPCEQSQILDLALEAERLRAALEELRSAAANVYERFAISSALRPSGATALDELFAAIGDEYMLNRSAFAGTEVDHG